MQRFILLLCLNLVFLYAKAQKDSIADQQISEVQVLAKVKPSTIRATSPLQVVNSEDIDRIGLTSMSDAVRRFSGVTVKDYGGVGGMKTVSIRGMGAQHTAVSYDGLVISNVQSGLIDIGRFSLDNISSISLTIGQSDDIFKSARSFASAGILSIDTDIPTFSNKNYELELHAKTGSFGLFNPSVYYAQKLNDKFSMSVSSSWQRIDGNYKFEIDNIETKEKGKRYNSDVDIYRIETNLYGNLGKAGLLKFKINYFDSERGIPGAVIFYNPYNDERVWNKDVFTQVHYKNQLNKQLSIQAQAKFSRTFYKYVEMNNNQGDGKLTDKITQFEYYASAGVLYKPFDKFSLSLNEDVFRNTLNSNYSDVKDPSRNSSLTALAAQYQSKRITLTGSLLATYINEKTKSEEEPDDRKKITPSLSLSYLPFDFTDLRVRASYKKIFRVPTFDDLYYVRMGNSNLKPEYATQYNIGLTWGTHISDFADYLSISVDGYKNKVKDKILAIPTANIFKMRNFGKVDMKGIDVNAKLNMNVSKDMAVNLAANYSYQEVIDVTDPNAKNYKDQVPYTPKNYGSGAISFENPWVNVAYTIILSGKRYFSDQNLTENELASYTDHSISVNKTIEFSEKKLRLQAGISNLANKNYQIIQNYPMPGRAYNVSANFIF